MKTLETSLTDFKLKSDNFTAKSVMLQKSM